VSTVKILQMKNGAAVRKAPSILRARFLYKAWYRSVAHHDENHRREDENWGIESGRALLGQRAVDKN
jgi:hypothetical protein